MRRYGCSRFGSPATPSMSGATSRRWRAHPQRGRYGGSTRRRPKQGSPGRSTSVEVDESDGMLAACVLSLDHAFLAEKVYLTERITELGAAKMDEVCRALATATGCS